MKLMNPVSEFLGL